MILSTAVNRNLILVQRSRGLMASSSWLTLENSGSLSHPHDYSGIFEFFSAVYEVLRVDYSTADGSYRHEVINSEPLPYRSYAAQVGTSVSAFIPRPVLYLSALYVTVLEY